MDTTEYIWMNGSIVPWGEAKVHVLTHSLHYGGAAFEGIRCYKTAKGTAVFRLREHIERLLYSCSTIRLDSPYSADELCEATLEVVRVNKLEQGYIRPLVFFGYGKMGLNPKGAPVETSISCWPWGAYLPHEFIDIKVSKYIRIHPGSLVPDAKISGHYVNSILAVQEVEGSQVHEALFLDYRGFVAEGPGENFFIVKDKIIYTPKLGSILAGITRDTVKRISAELGYQLVEKDLTVEEVLKADEAFFTGTAAEVTPINSINGTTLGAGGVGEVTRRIKSTYLDVVYGRNEKFEGLLTLVG